MENATTDKSRILVWFLLLVVLMTFGGLIAAYVVIATNDALEWRPFDLPFQVWISTAFIIASSVTYHFGRTALEGRSTASARNWFLITAGLGGVFISSQILVWMALVDRGLYMYRNPYAGFVYIMTATHAVHVLGGIIALGYVVLRTWDARQLSEPALEKNKNVASAVGWYWHTMDALWLLILLLLGFFK